MPRKRKSLPPAPRSRRCLWHAARTTRLKEHVFNILVEAGIETVGALMMSLKMDANKVLGLPGIGPKAMQNIEERLAAMQFPEPETSSG